MSKRRSFVALVAGALAALLLLPVAPASAASVTYVVNSTADDVDGGGCEATPNDCTLREAITAANANAGYDRIHFALGSGVPTIGLTALLPLITDRVAVNGNTGGATRVEVSGDHTPATQVGLHFSSSTADGSSVRKLVLNGFNLAALLINGADDMVVTGNWVGLDETGLAAVNSGVGDGIELSAGKDNQIGGLTAGLRNVVAGRSTAIDIEGGGVQGFNHILGNYVGTDRNGAGGPGLGNLLTGIDVAQSSGDVIEKNVVVGSGQVGIRVESDSHLVAVTDNRLGTDVAGNQVPNGLGIQVGSVGDTTSGVGLVSNLIDPSVGLAIDLGGDGVTHNDNADADSGPNGLQNFPVLTRADSLDASTTRVNGRLRSAPSATFVIQLFVNSRCDLSRHGEAEELLDAFTAPSDPEGRVTFSRLTGPTTVGEFVTATARNLATGDTSELSACIAVI